MCASAAEKLQQIKWFQHLMGIKQINYQKEQQQQNMDIELEKDLKGKEHYSNMGMM